LKLHFDFPGFAFIIIAFVAFGLSWFLYRKDDNFEKIKPVLIGLRTLSIFLIILLLLDIFLESQKDVEQKPIIILGFDNSESIFIKDSLKIEGYNSEWEAIISNLKNDYDVISLKIGENTVENDGLSFDEKKTNLSNFFTEIENRYYNSNIGAIVLATDGIFNEGMNPIYASEKMNYTPIYTIGLGDTSAMKDLKISNLFHNDIAFLKNKFPVELIISADGLENSTSKLIISREGKEVYSESFDIGSNRYNENKKILLNADQIGMNKYTIIVQKISGEEIIANNQRSFYIEVIDSRQKTLILANSPHPDVGALKFALENNSDMEVSSVNISDFKGNYKDFDVIVLHNLPSTRNNVPKEIIQAKKPILFVVGAQTDFRKLNALNMGFSYSGNMNTDAVYPSINSSFSLFKIDQNLNKVFKNSPPVFSRFAKVKFKGANTVFLKQKVGSIVKEDPLVFFNEIGGIKKGVINADGIWKWRLNDYSENETTENFDLLIDKIIQFVAVKEDKSNFRVKTKSIYNENEDVVFSAELYNESYELVNNEEVGLIITDEEGVENKYALLPYEDFYKLNLGQLKKGLYNYRASATIAGKTEIKEGQFLVKEIMLEYINLQAKHNVLRSISEMSGGQFLEKDNISRISDLIKSDNKVANVVYQEKSYKDIIDYKWLFILIALFLVIEWWLRKRLGTY
jgi:hypothetical protein